MKHNNLIDEIKMNEPDTSWFSTLCAVAFIVAVAFLIFVAVSFAY